MMQGYLRKMRAQLHDPVRYELILGDRYFLLNDYLNQNISLEFLGDMACIQCGRKIKKTFQQGYCFPCFQRIQECNNCQLLPEKCLVETGVCPMDDWAHAQCHQKHIVYLANTSALKVGVTRCTHVPMRWIDQGAVQALPILETHNRYQSGLLEVAFKAFVSDRTQWRDMLKRKAPEINLVEEKNKLMELADSEIQPILKQYGNKIIFLQDQAETKINYPIFSYPNIIQSLSFDDTPHISGKLLGIKGQYLILEHGVLNIRKFGGYFIQFTSDAFPLPLGEG